MHLAAIRSVLCAALALTMASARAQTAPSEPEPKPDAGQACTLEAPPGHATPPMSLPTIEARIGETTGAITWASLKRLGETARPSKSDTVAIRWFAWSGDGKCLHATPEGGPPQVVRLSDESTNVALQLLVPTLSIGEKRRFWVPADLACEIWGSSCVGVNLFDIELVSIGAPTAAAPAPPGVSGKAPAQVPPPSDLAAPPRGASHQTVRVAGQSTKIASVTLVKGFGKVKPKKGGRVTVRFTSWSEAGTTIDNVSQPKILVVGGDDEPLGLSLSLPQMVEGEKRRLWVPDEIVCETWGAQCPGALVYDVELVSVLK